MAVKINGYLPITSFKVGDTITSISNMTYYIEDIVKHGSSIVAYSIVDVDGTGETLRFKVSNTEPIFKKAGDCQKVIHVKLTDLWNRNK